jgi:hypothetical protein
MGWRFGLGSRVGSRLSGAGSWGNRKSWSVGTWWTRASRQDPVFVSDVGMGQV